MQAIGRYEILKDRLGVLLRDAETNKEVYFTGDDATQFLRELNRFKTNKTAQDITESWLSEYELIMKEQSCNN